MVVLAWCWLATALASPLVLGNEEGLSVKPGLLLNPRVTSELSQEPSLSLSIQRARPALRGTLLGPRAGFFVQAELAGTVQLLDAVVSASPVPWMTVSAGRFLVPFGRAQSTPVPKLQFHSFSRSATQEIHGRDVGLQLKASALDKRLDARVGVFQGATVDPLQPLPLAIGRVSFDLLGHVALDETEVINDPDGEGGLALGMGGMIGNDIRPADGLSLATRAVGFELAGRAGRVRVQSEVYLRHWSDALDEVGGYLQSSVALSRFELALRGDVINNAQLTWTGQGALNWYPMGDHLRTSLQYTFQQIDTATPTHTLAIQQQLWF